MRLIFIFITLFPISLYSQFSKDEPSKTSKISMVNRNGKTIAEIIRVIQPNDTIAKKDTVYSLGFVNTSNKFGFVRFYHKDSILLKLCDAYKFHLTAPERTNNTYTLGNTKITLVAVKKDSHSGVQLLTQQGIFTLWDDEPYDLFCNSLP